MIALSQNRTRVLKCTESTSGALPFPPGFPASLAEAMQTRQPDHLLGNRFFGGRRQVQRAESCSELPRIEYKLHFFTAGGLEGDEMHSRALDLLYRWRSLPPARYLVFTSRA